jgi:uncharacterized protein (DUF1501 family)
VRYDDLEFEEALPLLSVPAGRDDPTALSRRRFLQGALAAAGTGAAMPFLRPHGARAAELGTPLRPDEGVVVSVFLGGGNDGLNTVAPISGAARDQYDRLRGSIGIAPGRLLPLGDGWGLHPQLGALHGRFQRGRAAVVQGTGLPVADLSHFTSMAKVMQGRVAGEDGTGWLGRYVDGLADGDSGMRALSVGTSVPMTLNGRRARATSIPSTGEMYGADRRDEGENLVFGAIEAFAAAPSGLGPWGDRVAATGRAALADATTMVAAFDGGAGKPGLAHDLLLAARLINLDVGARVICVTTGGFDTHTTQTATHDVLLSRLDAALDVFFANLHPAFQRRTAVLVQSEFGRRPHANGALGTDHGTAAPMLLVGENVRGGVHGGAPDLGRLDDRDNLVPTVDFRAVYSQVLDRWLGGAAQQVLGGAYGGLDLFAARPGQQRP